MKSANLKPELAPDRGVSVIICCYNSVTRLPRTLEHLAKQGVPKDFNWEIIVVNNASSDNTKAYATEIWNELLTGMADFRVIDEERQGQLYARKRGAAEAKFDCVIFCDDDNWLDPGYVFLAYDVMNKDPMIGAAGGQNIPVIDMGSYPEWFETYRDKYAIGLPAEKSGDVSYIGFIRGAGMVTRKSLFLSMYDDRYPSLLNGRNGEHLTTGDDFEYCKRLLLRGYKLYYEERLKLDHFIPKERLTIEYRDRLMEGIYEAGKVLNEYDLAIRAYNRNKNKLKARLMLMAPLRIAMAKAGWSKRKVLDEQLALFYASPFATTPDPVKTMIKKFLDRK